MASPAAAVKTFPLLPLKKVSQDEYLSRPFDEDLLFAKLARLLGQKDQHEPEEQR
jgi:hypothetical protein